MQTEYDNKIDAKYVHIKKGKIAHTKKEEDWLLFDCASNGDVLGVEILNASKHQMSIYTVKGEFLGCSIAEPALASDDESLGLTVKSPEYTKESQFVPA